jgi:hypothetical protein
VCSFGLRHSKRRVTRNEERPIRASRRVPRLGDFPDHRANTGTTRCKVQFLMLPTIMPGCETGTQVVSLRAFSSQKTVPLRK